MANPEILKMDGRTTMYQTFRPIVIDRECTGWTRLRLYTAILRL